MTYSSTSPFDPSVYLDGQSREDIERTQSRFSMVMRLNPYMAAHPDAVAAMANLPISTFDLAHNAAGMYAVQQADTFRQQLEQMSPSQARAVFESLPASRQQALAQQGFAAPARPAETSFFGGIPIIGGAIDAIVPDVIENDVIGTAAHAVGAVAAPVLHAVGKVASPVISPALDTLQAIGNFPGYLYRSIRQLDDPSQIAALIVGVGAAAALSMTGVGLALGPMAQLGLLGMGGLAAGAAGGIAADQLGAIMGGTNDWIDAFGNSWNGESTFLPDARNRADELLGDPRLVTLAREAAQADVDMDEFAYKLASQQGDSSNDALKLIDEVAVKYGEQGTPGYRAAAGAMVNLLQDATFREAVMTLQRGKISMGRDVANWAGLEQGSGMYNILSGTIDGIAMFALDPTIMASEFYKSYRFAKVGIDLADAGRVQRLGEIYQTVPKVKQGFDGVANAVMRNDYRWVSTHMGQWRGAFDEMSKYVRAMHASGMATYEFTGEEMVKWLTETDRMRTLLAGNGTLRSTEHLLLQGAAPKYGLRTLGAKARAAIDGFSDANWIRAFEKAKEAGKQLDEYAAGLPDDVLEDLGSRGMLNAPWESYSGDLATYNRARAASNKLAPLGMLDWGARKVVRFLDDITTMVPRKGYIELAGKNADEEFTKFVEMTRHLGVPAWQRRMMVQEFTGEGINVGARSKIVASVINDAMRAAGSDLLPEGRRLREVYVQRLLHVYSPGSTGELVDDAGNVLRRTVWENELATAAMVPDLHELRNAIRQNKLAQLVGASDSGRIAGFTNRIWKPSVLLRLGFPLRAGGEELLAFLARGTSGSLVQEAGARGVARYEAFMEVEARRLRNLGTEDIISAADKRVMDAGPWGGWLGSIERMFGHGSWDDPVHNLIDRGVRWRNRVLTEGLGRDELIDGLRRRITTDGTAPLGTFSRHNLAARADAVVFGRPQSWRRMALGGIDDVTLEAARSLASTHIGTVAAEISAVNNGVDYGQSNNSVHFENVLRDDGTFERVRVETMRGRFRATFRDAADNAHGDARHLAAVHDNMTKWLRAPTTRKAVADHIWRVPPRGLIRRDLAEAVDLYRADNVKGYGRLLLNEFLGNTRATDAVGGLGVYLPHHVSQESVGAFVEALRKGTPDFGAYMADELASLGDTVHVGNFREIADRYLKEQLGEAVLNAEILRENPGIRAAAHISQAMEQAEPLIARLAALDDETRAFYAAVLRASRDWGSGGFTGADVLANVLPGGRRRGYEHVSWLNDYDAQVDEIAAASEALAPLTSAGQDAWKEWSNARKVIRPSRLTGPLEDEFMRVTGGDRMNIAMGARPGGEFDPWNALPPKLQKEMLKRNLVYSDPTNAAGLHPDQMAQIMEASGFDDSNAAIEWYLDMARRVVAEQQATHAAELAAARDALAEARAARAPHAARVRTARRKLEQLLTEAEARGDAAAVRLLRQDGVTGRAVPLRSDALLAPGVGNQPMFVNSFDEIVDDMQRSLYGAAMAPDAQRITAAFDGLPNDPAGALDDALVQVYELPIENTWLRSVSSVEELAAYADDPALILQNKQILGDALRATRSADVPQTIFVANPALARQIDLAAQRYRIARSGETVALTNNVRIAKFPRGILGNEEVDGLRALSRNLEDRTITSWRIEKDRVAARLAPWPDPVHDGAWAIAGDQVAHLRTWLIENNANWMQPRYIDRPVTARRSLAARAADRLPDGMVERLPQGVQNRIPGRAVDDVPDLTDVPTERASMVYTKDPSGRLVPIPEGTKIRANDLSYTNADGEDISPIDLAYFEPGEPTLNAAGGLMWRALGPMVEDAYDMETGYWRTMARHYIVPSGRKEVGVTEAVRMARSRSSDVDLHRALPVAFEPSKRVIKRRSIENFVRYAFDDVISPMIDAIARRPMMQHQFTMRYRQAKQMREYLFDPDEMKAIADLAHSAGLTKPSQQFLDDMRLVAYHWEGSRLPADVPSELWVDPLRWSDKEVLSWVRGHSAEDLQRIVNSPSKLAEQLTSEAATRVAIRANAEAALSKARADKFHYFDPPQGRPARIVIAGDRGWVDPASLEAAMFEAWKHYGGNVTFVIGDSRGAQMMATDIAREMGWNVESFASDFKHSPRRAVYKRNQQMMQSGADGVLSFKHNLQRDLGTGETEDLIRTALDRKLPVVHFDGKSWQHVETAQLKKLRAALPATMDQAVVDREVQALKSAGARLRDTPIAAARSFMPENATAGDVLAFVRSRIPTEVLDSRGALTRWLEQNLDATAEPWLAAVTPDEWNMLLTAHKSDVAHTLELGELASQGAIADLVPFIDSHEFRTQFSSWAKGLMPFWYAEENFMRRWSRVLVDGGPAVVRRMQLGYMGFRHSGLVRTDENGRDWFVYPGSGLLTDTIRQLFPSVPVDLGSTLATPTDSMLPGITGDSNRLGAPSFAPALTIPLTQLAGWMPELNGIKYGVMGEQSFDVKAFEQLFPTTLRNFARAAFASDGDQQFASAMMSAISNLEGNEATALPENADARQRDEYMTRVRNHARTIMVARALGGFLGFSTTTAVESGNTDNLLSIGTEDPRSALNTEYLQMVRLLGVNEGTMEFLAMHPDADPSSLLAQTVGTSESVTGAPLPSTDQAVDFYEQNSDFFSEYPSGAPWILPYGDAAGTTRSRYAFDHQLATGLRLRRTPDEYLDAVKFKMASGAYFDTKAEYDAAIDKARLAKNTLEVSRLNSAWQMWATAYKESHPLFAAELETGNGALRRKQVLSDLRTMLRDPLHPGANDPNSQASLVGTVVDAFDAYQLQLNELRLNKTIRGKLAVEDYKKQWAAWGTNYIGLHPEVASFWQSVIVPESNLD